MQDSICFYTPNFRLISFQVMNIAFKEVLQACIYLVETCQGGSRYMGPSGQ